MRRFFSVSFIALALLISAAGAAPAAHAGPLPEGNACPQGSFWISDRDRCEYDEFSPAELITEDQAVEQETAATASRIANDRAAAKPTDLKPDTDSMYSGIMIKIMSLFAWLVGVAAVTLDYAVYYTVVTMGSYVEHLSAVGVTWRILRDIANIMLIFGFLGAGIATILNVDQYGWKTKMLPMLFVAAIFLNFSLFITEAMIDGTNLFATQFYTQIKGGSLPTASYMSNTTWMQQIENEGVSNKIMGQLGLQTIYDIRTNQSLLKAGNSWLIGFMGIILFIITAFVLFSLAFILIARFVALIFFIILSPVGFMGLAIPQMQYRAGQWWKNFLEQIITAPILMLLLYVALAVITDAQFLTGSCVPSTGSTNTTCTPDWTGFADGNLTGFASMMLSFLVAMGLLLVVVIKAKSMSAFGAGWATKAASRLSGATILAAGAAKSTRWVGRNTLGRAGTTRIGKALGMGGLANATFDFRNSQLAKKAGRDAGLDLGTGGKGGYKTYVVEQQKSQRKKLVGTNLRKAEGAEATATKAHSQLKTQHDITAAEYAKQKTEVERLEAEQAKDKYWNNVPANVEKLDVARAAAAASKKTSEDTEAAMVVAEAALKRTQEAAERMREKMDKIEERAELQELKDALKEGATKTSTERGTEKKEAKPEEKK